MYVYSNSNRMVSIDWLQAYCSGDYIAPGLYSSPIGTLKVSLEGGVSNFSKRYIVKLKDGVEVATILQAPNIPHLDKKLTEVKLHNRVLYTCEPIRILMAVIDTFSLEYRGITRIDLCCDCNCLAGGRSVEELMSSFIHKSVGEIGHVVRRGSAKYILHGNNHRKAAIRHESIKFGSPSSDVVPYIYNKSLELISEKDKPWIRNAWKHAGLVHLVDDEGMKRLTSKELAARVADEGLSSYIRSGVWRFEISIKAHGKDLLNLSTGEIFKLSPDEISTHERVCELFNAYADKYFDFRICDHGQKAIRQYKPIVLWDGTCKPSYKPYSIPSTGSTGRFEQSVVNYINRAMREYSDLASPLLCGLQDTKEFIASIGGMKSYKARKQRYMDYLASLEGSAFYESLQIEVGKEFGDPAIARDMYREYLNSLNKLNESPSTKSSN